jgi:sirohydrochlorin cobaltochelatase
MTVSKKLPAIVLAVFGASSATAREVYRDVEARVRESYPNHEIAWAYLSRHIVNKQRKLGVVLPTLPEALNALKDAGFDEVLVQPLLITPGEEFAIAKSVECAGMKLKFGAPLLTSETDIQAAIAAIAPLVQEDVANVMVCHGNGKHNEYNQPLLKLKKISENIFENLIVASIEGEPGTEPLQRAKEISRAHDSVVFIPFMMIAGEHIVNDVMGDEPDSWKSIVGAAHSSCLGPLGKNAAILNIFLDHMKVAMQNLQEVRQND